MRSADVNAVQLMLAAMLQLRIVGINDVFLANLTLMERQYGETVYKCASER